MEPDHVFISAAEWPDDIKGQKWTNFNILHFTNYPVIDPNFEGSDIKTAVDNVTLAFNECHDTLSKPIDDLTVIPKSICMRLMIHLLGDIHQPLHTATLFSKEFPSGDMGGNLFKVIFPASTSMNELHAFWDSTAKKYSGSIKVPLTDNHYDQLQEIAFNITGKWNRANLSEELKKKTFNEWTAESGKLAYEVAYDKLKLQSGTKLTLEYQQMAQDLIDKQLVLGGLRLADTLSLVLSSEPSPIIEDMLKHLLRNMN